MLSGLGGLDFLGPSWLNNSNSKIVLALSAPCQSSLLSECLWLPKGAFFLAVIGLVMAMPSYGRELINLLSRNQLCHIACDINGSVYSGQVFKGTFLFCYCCGHLERKPASSKCRCMQLSEVDMGIGLLLIIIINKVMINRGQFSEVQKHSHRRSVYFLK